jgi:predicted TIM-barrel fold metal-dependent hydrolase
VKGLGSEENSWYLSALRTLRSSCRFYDVHVHPYEILFDRFSYDSDYSNPLLLNLPGKSYTAPSLSQFQFPETAEFNDEPRSQQLRDISVMLLRRVYGSVGEQVFVDQMNLSAVDQVLLLPAAPDSSDAPPFDDRMRWVKKLYGNQEKFWIAGCIPPSVSGEEIRQCAANQQQQYGIKALKCHPVVSGIDLGTTKRKEWLEMMLLACRQLKLPLLIHGGRNNPYWGGSRGNFGSIGHLKEINFSLSQHPVILAHAGLHRCSIREIKQEGLPILKKMLESHANLYIDISGIGFEPMKLVLQSVESDRIIFGSDALYVPQWEAVTMTMHALKELGMQWEERFVQLASINPKRIIFKDQEPC